MTRLKPLLQSKLRDDVHQALKWWGKFTDESSPLEYLYLFREALRAEDSNASQATNKILSKALKMLEEKYGTREADFLRFRFQEQALISNIAIQFNIAESTAFTMQREAIQHLAAILYDQEHQARDKYLSDLENKLALPPYVELIGIEEPLNDLWDLLSLSGPGWLISIEGLGGIGKTALANAVIREIAPTSRFFDVAWVNAKRQDFWPDMGLQQTERPALDSETLVDTLLEQLGDEASRSGPPQQKMAILAQLLKDRPYLVVIDNLETVIDYQTLLPLLRKLANPSKFLLTSRYRPRHSDVAHLRLKPLSQADTLVFLKQEAEVRRLSTLANASQAQLKNIYEVVGGNPLALKLVVGQIHALPLSQVLESLRKARGKKIDELYTYIYWQAWQTLAPASRQALLVMPLTQNGTIDQLATASRLDMEELHQALEQLVDLSLLEVSGDDIEQRRYRIHRLTETFLLTEVAKWQSSL